MKDKEFQAVSRDDAKSMDALDAWIEEMKGTQELSETGLRSLARLAAWAREQRANSEELPLVAEEFVDHLNRSQHEQ